MVRGRTSRRAERGAATPDEGSDPARHAQQALEAARLGTFELDLERGRIWWDEGACAILGIDPRGAERSLDEALSRVHPADRSTVERALEAAVADGSSGLFVEEMRVEQRGRWRWIGARAHVRLDGAADRPRPARLVGVVADITARKSKELAADRQARMLALSHDAILAWELTSGRVHLWNRGARDLYGHAEREALGRDRRALIPSRYDRGWAAIAAELRRRGRWEAEGRHRTRAGDERMVATRMQLLVDDEVGLLVLEVGRDVTDERRAREALEEANRQKESFLAMLSHELRRPLAALAHAAELQREWLDEAPEESARRRVGEVIRRQTVKMERLVNDLLDVARVGHGKIALERRPLELAALLRDTLQDHHAAFASAGVKPSLRLEAPDAVVRGDPVRLAQVVGNLLSNAAKFTPPGGRVAITLRREGDEAVLVVADDGEGLDPEVLARLFEPFQQASSDGRGGLGLGLALVRDLTELHGGRVEAASDGPGTGSRFTVRLPLERAADGATRADERPCGCCGPLALDATLLLVDDDPDSAEMLGLALRRRGYRVALAADGEEALERARALRPAVVLSDLDLGGGMDGHALAAALRREPDLRDAVLVAVSGAAAARDQARAKAAGFAAHFAKPLELTALEAFLAEHAKATASAE